MTIWLGGCGGGGGGGGTSQDRFAPKYLVGNVPAGDTAAAYATAGFVYFADPGDGTGIQAALAAAAATPGDVWIRPGTYNLTTGPLTVPGVVVRGAGAGVTIITTPSTGDQGVFVLATTLNLSRFASLHDMTINVLAPTGATAGSVAAIVTQDPTWLERVVVSISPNAQSTLTRAVQMTATTSSFPASDLLDVTLASAGDGAAPSIGLDLVYNPNLGSGPTVLARGLQVFGATSFSTGVRVEGSVLIASQLVVAQFTDVGVTFIEIAENPNAGSVRIDEGQVLTGAASLLTYGIALQGGRHVLRSLNVLGNSLGEVGIRMIARDQGSAEGNQIEDCFVEGWRNGIIGGEIGLTSSGIQNTTVTDCGVRASSRGIWFTGPIVSGNHILDNDVQVSPGGSQPPIGGILFEEDPQQVGGIENFIKGNRANVSLSIANPNVHAISTQSQLTVIEGNVASIFSGGYAIALLSGSERVTVTGNITNAADGGGGDSLGCIYVAPGTPNVSDVINGNNCTANYAVDPVGGFPAAIVCEGQRTVVSNNTVSMGTPGGASPGITLTAVSTQCNAIGNICQGSGGVAVTDLGALNNVAQNIGA